MTLRSTLRSPIMLPALSLAAALWPVWPWYHAVLTEPWGEPWGLLALLTAFAFIFSVPLPRTVHRRWLVAPGMVLLLYAGSFPFLSPLLRGTLAFATIGCLLGSWRLGKPFHPGLLGLMLLALPIIPPLQFYIGYPLRLVTAHASASLLSLHGLAITAVGTCLDWNGSLVAVDAPCSGVRMLWTGLYLTMMLSCFLRLSPLRTITFTLLAVFIVVAGNILRTATLFYTESGILSAPSWTHDGIGGAAFLSVAVVIGMTARYLQRRNECAIA